VSEDFFDEALKDAKVLAGRINLDDYESLKTYWQSKSFTLIASMLRRYGIDFKGLTYLETLMDELFKIKEQKTKPPSNQG